MQVEIKDDRFDQMLAKMEKACVDLSVLYKKIYYEVMLPSIMQNFNSEGRYDANRASGNKLSFQESIQGGKQKWAPLRPATVKQKLKKYGNKPILQATEALKNGVHARITPKELGISSVAHGNFAQTGTNRNNPARPWLVVQDEDRKKITKLVKDYFIAQKK